MAGCFGSHPEDRMREIELDKYLDERDGVVRFDEDPLEDDFEEQMIRKAKEQFNGLFSSISSAVMK